MFVNNLVDRALPKRRTYVRLRFQRLVTSWRCTTLCVSILHRYEDFCVLNANMSSVFVQVVLDRRLHRGPSVAMCIPKPHIRRSR